MATLSQLVDTIADVEGIDPATAKLVARYIREAGLITTGGRGLSAAPMDFHDAANLLIGMNAATKAADAARIVSLYRGLRSYDRAQKKYVTFGDAIEQLLQATVAGTLGDKFVWREMTSDLREAFVEGRLGIEVKFVKSAPFASIELLLPDSGSPTSDGIEPWSEFASSVGELIQFYPSRRQARRSIDRIEELTIGLPTLRAIGKLLRP
jgi:hypothetical protein